MASQTPIDGPIFGPDDPGGLPPGEDDGYPDVGMHWALLGPEPQCTRFCRGWLEFLALRADAELKDEVQARQAAGDVMSAFWEDVEAGADSWGSRKELGDHLCEKLAGAISKLRRDTRKAPFPLSQLKHVPVALIEQPRADLQLIKEERQAALARLAKDLPKKARRLYTLLIEEERTIEMAALLMGSSVKAATKGRERLFNRLREGLERMGLLGGGA